LKHFDNFWTHLFILYFSLQWPFSGIYFNPFLSKMRTNSVFLIIFRRLAIILDFIALWAIKNEEMAIVWTLFSELHVYSSFCQILKIHWKLSLFFANWPFFLVFHRSGNCKRIIANLLKIKIVKILKILHAVDFHVYKEI
jgi:hypothetical protein